MKKKTIELKAYAQEDIEKVTESYVRAAHNQYLREEQRHGEKIYPTFGEWKKKNPNNPIAKKNYPEEEFIQVIAAYHTYFNNKCINIEL